MDFSINQNSKINNTQNPSVENPINQSYSEVSNSIFTQAKCKNIKRENVDNIIKANDNNPKDGVINESEFQKIKEAVGKLYDSIVNNTKPSVSVEQPKPPTAEEIAESITPDALKEDIDQFKNLGYEVEMASDNVIKITRGNESGTITIATDGTLTFAGCAQRTMQEASLNNTLDKYEKLGYRPVGSPVKNDQGELIGTLQNEKGEIIRLNLNTGQEVKE